MKAGIVAAALSICLTCFCPAATKIEKVLPFARCRRLALAVHDGREKENSDRKQAIAEHHADEISGGMSWRVEPIHLN